MSSLSTMAHGSRGITQPQGGNWCRSDLSRSDLSRSDLSRSDFEEISRVIIVYHLEFRRPASASAPATVASGELHVFLLDRDREYTRPYGMPLPQARDPHHNRAHECRAVATRLHGRNGGLGGQP